MRNARSMTLVYRRAGFVSILRTPHDPFKWQFPTIHAFQSSPHTSTVQFFTSTLLKSKGAIRRRSDILLQ